MNNPAEMVIAVFEVARDQERNVLTLLIQANEDTHYQRKRYDAAQAVVTALQAYADLIGGK